MDKGHVKVAFGVLGLFFLLMFIPLGANLVMGLALKLFHELPSRSAAFVTNTPQGVPLVQLLACTGLFAVGCLIPSIFQAVISRRRGWLPFALAIVVDVVSFGFTLFLWSHSSRGRNDLSGVLGLPLSGLVTGAVQCAVSYKKTPERIWARSLLSIGLSLAGVWLVELLLPEILWKGFP